MVRSIHRSLGGHPEVMAMRMNCKPSDAYRVRGRDIECTCQHELPGMAFLACLDDYGRCTYTPQYDYNDSAPLYLEDSNGKEMHAISPLVGDSLTCYFARSTKRC